MTAAPWSAGQNLAFYRHFLNGTEHAIGQTMSKPTTPQDLEAMARKIDRLRKQALALLLSMPLDVVASDEQNEAFEHVRKAHGALGSVSFELDSAAHQLTAHDTHQATIARIKGAA